MSFEEELDADLDAQLGAEPDYTTVPVVVTVSKRTGCVTSLTTEAQPVKAALAATMATMVRMD